MLSLLRIEFNKLNNTGSRIEDSIYHMVLKLLQKRLFGVKTSGVCRFPRNAQWKPLNNVNMCKPLISYRFRCMTLYQTQTQRHILYMCIASQYNGLLEVKTRSLS